MGSSAGRIGAGLHDHCYDLSVLSKELLSFLLAPVEGEVANVNEKTYFTSQLDPHLTHFVLGLLMWLYTCSVVVLP